MSRWLKFSIGLLPHLWFAQAQYARYCRNLYLPRIFKAITPVPFRWSAFNSETVSQHYLRIIQLTTAAADCTILFADYIGTSTRLTALATLHWIIFMTRSFLFGAFQTLGTVFLKCKVTDQMKNTLLVQLEG